MTFDGPIPFDEAIAYAQRKGLLPTSLTSIQIAQLRRQLKQRAVFSARLDKASVLQVLQDQITKIVSNEGIEDENGRLRSIPEAKSQLREAMVKAGVPFAKDGKEGKITDFYSDKRRQLMIETNVLDTLGAGQHVALQSALDSLPGLELVRSVVPKGGTAAERDWVQRWHDAMDAIDAAADAGCTDPDEAGGRMVALVNHPIWQALGDGAGGYADTLGNPWAPLAFNSGMSQLSVPREECVELGIMTDDQEIEPDHSIDLNAGLQANASRFSEALQQQLAGGGLQILDGVLRLVKNRAARVRQASPFAAQRGRLRQMLDVMQEAA
jgi:hypothetical protein